MMFRIIEKADSNQFFGFDLDSKKFCLNLGHLKEIINVPNISKLPNLPIYIEGAIDYRGKIIRILNLRRWLNLTWKPLDRFSRIVIVSKNDNLFGILIDKVGEVFKLYEVESYSPPMIIQQELDEPYISQILFREKDIFFEINMECLSVTE